MSQSGATDGDSLHTIRQRTDGAQGSRAANLPCTCRQMLVRTQDAPASVSPPEVTEYFRLPEKTPCHTQRERACVDTVGSSIVGRISREGEPMHAPSLALETIPFSGSRSRSCRRRGDSVSGPALPRWAPSALFSRRVLYRFMGLLFCPISGCIDMPRRDCGLLSELLSCCGQQFRSLSIRQAFGPNVVPILCRPPSSRLDIFAVSSYTPRSVEAGKTCRLALPWRAFLS